MDMMEIKAKASWSLCLFYPVIYYHNNMYNKNTSSSDIFRSYTYTQPHTQPRVSYRSFFWVKDSTAVWTLDWRADWWKLSSDIQISSLNLRGATSVRANYLSVSLSSLDSTSSRAAWRSTMRRMDVSRSACNACLTVLSSSTFISCTEKEEDAGMNKMVIF